VPAWAPQPEPAPAYMPPAVQAPTPPYVPAAAPMPYQPYSAAPMAPPAAKPRRTGRLLLIIGLIVVLLLGAAGAGAVVANASLASTYSPDKAVTDYLAAQKRGDVNFMSANANYLKGDGSYSEYFDQFGLKAMMSNPQNADISSVKVESVTAVDANTSTVTVGMTWAGHQLHRGFAVHKDPSRVHFMFYDSWRIDIPFASIHVTVPDQPGGISIDGFPLPAGASTGVVEVIQGFHAVTMNSTDLYDRGSANADAIETDATVAFPSKLSATAVTAAIKTIKKAFNTCVPRYEDCLGHVYHAPVVAFTIYYFNLPGYGEVDYTTYVYTLTSDPTKGMRLVVESDAGKVAASGNCAYTLTVNGTRHLYFKGTWTATLTMSGGSFGYDFTYDCEKAKA
jgi:hypothetical protein